MAHHYAGGEPQDHLNKKSVELSNLPAGETFNGDLNFTGVEEALEDTENLQKELMSQAAAEMAALDMAGKLGSEDSHAISSEYYELLQLVWDNDSRTPEELHMTSDYTRPEFFGLAADLSENGYLRLENGSIELTDEGYNAFEGINLLQEQSESFFKLQYD